MLKTFKVSNFRGFNSEIILDFSKPNSYDFNSECVKNGIIRCGIIHGLNGSGKSNLGLALFDIFRNLSDVKTDAHIYRNYLNGDNDSNAAEFEYTFEFEGVEVIYNYSKSSYTTFEKEKLTIDGKVVVDFDRSDGNETFTTTLEGTESLNTMIPSKSLSALKYIWSNSVLAVNKTNTALREMFDFVERMLFFKSLDDRYYIGKDPEHNDFMVDIIEDGLVAEYEAFLRDAGINCKLEVVEKGGTKIIYNCYKSRKLPLIEVWSTGTASLTLLFCWLQRLIKGGISFLFIDEYDAFYHFRLSKRIIRILKESDVQFVVTTHNTSNITNDLLRPDCYFLIDNGGISSLSRRTRKELREAHNIEKMFKAGAFDCDE